MDIGIYFEIDSFLPIREEFEFMRSSSYKKTDIMGEGFKLRTMRFRGQISQGLLLPVSQFPEIPSTVEVGDDVTELLGVRKWEIEERATTGGTVIGNLPYDIPHTDETRVQEYPELIGAFAGLEYYISTKMDGSSHSIGIDENGFHVTGHNYEYKDDGVSSFYNLVKDRKYQERVEALVKDLGLRTLTIQGELCAPGIQRNRLRLAKPEWYVFTIRENGKRVGLNRMLELCKMLDFVHVPIEEVDVDLPSKYPTVEALLERADWEYPNGGKKEGIVIRPTEPVFCPLISASLSMKVVSNKYLLKNEA
jgi:RNA ligase (TIGR02306 family)